MTELFREWEVAEAQGEPIRFRLAGVDFYAIPEAPFGYLADFMAEVMAGHVGLPTCEKFLQTVLGEGQTDVLTKVLRDPSRPVPKDMVQEIVDWLIECYSGGRPTGPPSGSSDGRRSTTDSSEAGSSSPAAASPSRPGKSSTLRSPSS